MSATSPRGTGGQSDPPGALPSSSAIASAAAFDPSRDLTVAILTLNEAKDITDCVRSVTRAAEIVVLDSGSTDGTVELAKAAASSIPVRVATQPFVNYSAQRNVALGLVRTEWLLFLDADERLTPDLESEIGRILRNPDADAYWIPRKNVLLGRWMRHTGWSPDEQLRLVRRSAAWYDEARPVHEVAEVDGSVGHLTQALIHHNYRSLGEFIEKQRYYARFDAEQIRRQGMPRLRALAGQPARELKRRYVDLQGYKDGWRGLVFSLLLAHAKLQAVRRARTSPPTPPLRGEGSTAGSATRPMGTSRRPCPQTPTPRRGGVGGEAPLRLPSRGKGPGGEVSVVIVSWNVRELLLRCLQSMERELGSRGGDVWVVDNGSSDGSADAVARLFPWVRVIRQVSNPGFAAANNQALALCRGQAALLVNPDAELLPGSLAAMSRRLWSCPDVGVVGPLLLNPDGSVQSSRRRFPTLRTGLFESTTVQRHLPSLPSLRRYYVADLPDSRPQVVDWVHGACFMVRREAWEQAGPLDPGFHMYSEELDWQRRIRDAGWRVVFEPDARVIHHGGQSSGQVALATHLRFHASKYRYFRLHHGRAAAAFLWWSIGLMHILQLWEEAAKLALGHKPTLRRERLGYLSRAIAWHAGLGA